MITDSPFLYLKSILFYKLMLAGAEISSTRYTSTVYEENNPVWIYFVPQRQKFVLYCQNQFEN